MTDFTPVDANVYRLCQLYNDSGVDKIIIFDLSTSDDEHEKNVNTIRNINRNIDIKVCAGGNINRLEDIKKLLFAGCLQVILNASKPSSIGLAEEASARFGKDRILLSINNVDFIFKNQDSIENTFHEALVLNPEILDALENLTNIPYVVELPDYNFDEIVRLLKREKIRGIAGPFINDTSTDIMKLKSSLLQEGINMYNFAPDLSWEDLKLNSDGSFSFAIVCISSSVLFTSISPSVNSRMPASMRDRSRISLISCSSSWVFSSMICMYSFVSSSCI